MDARSGSLMDFPLPLPAPCRDEREAWVGKSVLMAAVDSGRDLALGGRRGPTSYRDLGAAIAQLRLDALPLWAPPIPAGGASPQARHRSRRRPRVSGVGLHGAAGGDQMCEDLVERRCPDSACLAKLGDRIRVGSLSEGLLHAICGRAL